MINRRFRKHPELEPSGKISIMGRTLCRPEKMAAYAERRNPRAPDVARIYVDKGGRYGVRGDIAFCQAMHDTRTWTMTPQGPPWRPFAPSVWGCADPDWTDAELEKRTDLHLRQLFAFAEKDDKAACWEDLNGRWVIPGTRYGQDILAIWRNMMAWKGEGEGSGMSGTSEREMTGKEAEEREAGNGDGMAWLAERGWLPSPEPHPDRKVTWAELAGLFKKWENARK